MPASWALPCESLPALPQDYVGGRPQGSGGDTKVQGDLISNTCWLGEKNCDEPTSDTDLLVQPIQFHKHDFLVADLPIFGQK